MNSLNSSLFSIINTTYNEAYKLHLRGEMTTEDFYAIKKVFGSAKKELLPSHGKAMSSIEKDLKAKYGTAYSR